MKKKSLINSTTILQRNPKQLFTLIDEEVVMLNIKHEEYLNLNHHASYIWKQLKTPCTFLKSLIKHPVLLICFETPCTLKI